MICLTLAFVLNLGWHGILDSATKVYIGDIYLCGGRFGLDSISEKAHGI